ncbi:hornerin-like [Iris pallida]|uniref:Hornerin-like n=1 Tax=Iris pallida TaxID=29817 RepID=A0AAX6GM34_IRIPA|nr:hornerin-like [Iris pallida]
MEQCRQGKSANGSVTSGKGLALRTGHGGPSPEPVGCRRTARAAHAARAGRRVPAGGRTGNGPPRGGPSPGVEQSTQNWYGQGESDCLIKTKHCDGPCGCSRNVISCSECQSEEIQPSAGKRRE